MSDQEKPEKLTPESPVAKETLEEFNNLEEARFNLGLQMLQLEQSRVQLLAAAHKVDEHQKRLFERVLMERGLPVNSQVSIDSTTGQLTLVKKPEQV